MKLEVGQRVILERLNLRFEGAGVKRCQWVTVTTVGRKYFEVSEVPRDVRFRLEDLLHDTCYGASYRIHLSDRDLYEDTVATTAYHKLKSIFGDYRSHQGDFTPGQLMSACDALGLTEEVHEALKPQMDKLQEELAHESDSE